MLPALLLAAAPQQSQSPGPVYLPPVHLIPNSTVPRPNWLPERSGEPTPAQPAGSSVVTTSASSPLDDPFRELEQDLLAPPVERISQTPADPATRPDSRSLNGGQPVPPQSVLNGAASRLPPPARIAPDNELVPLPGERMDSMRGGVAEAWPASSSDNRPPYVQDEPAAGQDNSGDTQEPTRRPADKDCDEFRQKLLVDPIVEIALDISPPRHPRASTAANIYRDWLDLYGQLICSGTLVDLRRGYIIVDTGAGRQKISVADLGEADLAAVASAWQIPRSCLVSSGYFAGRCWEGQTITWHAANLCHKPLYFEEVALERYGHSDGPFVQPLRSTAHFFVNLLTLPYQTGIHPPNECIYALGYYRPGNCAPWLAYPVPISREGAARQATVMLTGAYTLF